MLADQNWSRCDDLVWTRAIQDAYEKEDPKSDWTFQVNNWARNVGCAAAADVQPDVALRCQSKSAKPYNLKWSLALRRRRCCCCS